MLSWFFFGDSAGTPPVFWETLQGRRPKGNDIAHRPQTLVLGNLTKLASSPARVSSN